MPCGWDLTEDTPDPDEQREPRVVAAQLYGDEHSRTFERQGPRQTRQASIGPFVRQPEVSISRHTGSKIGVVTETLKSQGYTICVVDAAIMFLFDHAFRRRPASAFDDPVVTEERLISASVTRLFSVFSCELDEGSKRLRTARIIMKNQ